MSELKGYRCPNCGNMLQLSQRGSGIYRCECCGSEYEKDYDGGMGLVIRPYVVRPQIETFESVAKLDHYMLDEVLSEENKVGIVEHTIKSMARDLAEQLIPYIEITTQRDLCTMALMIRGKLQVVKPDTGLYEYLNGNRRY